jgi:hypothetical protein
VITIPINMKRCNAPVHFAAAVNAFHSSILVLKLLRHSFKDGMYAVIMAKKSSFGEHTT